MGWQQTGNILVGLLGLASLVILTNCYCPDSQICNCSSESVKCICHQREDIKFLEEDEEEEMFTGKEIIIKGCRKVDIMKHSLKDLSIETIYISEVTELYIEPYTFDGSHIGSLHIYNISVFHLEPYSLGNIKYVFSLVISNATFENLLPSILGDTGANNVSILNSYIGTIRSRALHFQNTENLVLENNVINAFDLSSIAGKNIRNFKFSRNMVVQSNFGSISLSLAENVDFGYCTFRHIQSSMIITNKVDTFSFHDSHIEHCGERAFWGIQANQRIRFVNNQIMLASEDCLLPNLGPNGIISIMAESANNTFVCNCDLEWLFVNENPSYDIIKEQNICHDPPHLKGLRLSQLQLSMDRHGTCISLHAFDTTVPTSTVIPTTTERKTNKQQTRSTLITRKRYRSTASSIRAITTPPTQPKVKEKYVKTVSSADTCSSHSFFLSLLFTLAITWVQEGVY